MTATAAPERQPPTTRRRRPRLRWVLTAALVGVSLVSVLALGGYNYVVVRGLLGGAIESQLDNHQQAQVRAIDNGLERLGDAVSLIARSPATTEALADLSAAYRDLATGEDRLTPAQSAALDSFYTDALAAGEIAVGGGDDTGELAPTSPAGRYLQYHYLVDNPFPADRRDELDRAPGDRTAYGRAHVDAHRALTSLRSAFGLGDILLLDTQGDVVYSTDKRVDFGTDTTTSPLRHRGLTEALGQRLSQVAVGETVLVDFLPYAPAGGRPTMFAAAAVRDGVRSIGAVVAEIPVDRLNAITTSEGQWLSTGLGQTGETYIVGSDRLMRSDARLWLEDPDAYLASLEDAGYPPALGAAIVEAGTTALLQPVRTEGVEEAFGRERFVGRSDDYLGRPALLAAGPLADAELDWIVVAELTIGEANAVLQEFNRSLLLAALLLVPLVAALGLVLADRITRPVEPVVATAAAVAEGDLDARAPDLGRHEVGDVGRRLNALTVDLARQREARAAEEREITQLLLSALPARLVDQVRSDAVEVDDLADTGTVIALTVRGPLERDDLAREEALEASSRLSLALEQTAARLGIERVRSASDHHLFAAGLGRPEVDADLAATFVTEVVDAFAAFERDTGIDVTYHAGLSAGPVVAGLVHPQTLTYGVFGEPTQTALALDAVAVDGQVLLHPSVADALGPEWQVQPATGLVDLRGEQVDAQLLTGRRAASPDQPVIAET